MMVWPQMTRMNGSIRLHPCDLWFISRAAQRDAGSSGRHLIVFQHGRAVHDHVTDTQRKLVRFVEGRLIDDRVLVEDHEVSRKAFANQTAIAKAERLRREGSHFPDRVLE